MYFLFFNEFWNPVYYIRFVVYLCMIFGRIDSQNSIFYTYQVIATFLIFQEATVSKPVFNNNEIFKTVGIMI